MLFKSANMLLWGRQQTWDELRDGASVRWIVVRILKLVLWPRPRFGSRLMLLLQYIYILNSLKYCGGKNLTIRIAFVYVNFLVSTLMTRISSDHVRLS